MEEYTTKMTGIELQQRIALLTADDWQSVIDTLNTIPISDRSQRRWEGFENVFLTAEYNHFK